MKQQTPKQHALLNSVTRLNRVPTHLESQGINLVTESRGILLMVRELW